MSSRKKHVLTGLGVMVFVGLVVALVVMDFHLHARARHERALVTTARTTLSRSNLDLFATHYSQYAAIGHRTTLQASVNSTLGQLATTEQTLASTSATSFLQGLDIGTIQSCLGGVQNALVQIGDHNNSQATTDISAVAPSCSALEPEDSSGPVYPFDFPDPFILTVGNMYYAYATNSTEGNIQIIESTDLIHWTTDGNALPSLPGWAQPNATWAPSVLQISGQFVLYYSAVVAGPGGGEQCISSATSSLPQGPFVDNSPFPLVCQATMGGSIDPSPFVDTNGTPYLMWKSNGVATGSSALWSEQLNPAGTGFAGSAPTPLLGADQSWEAGIVEAPDLIEHHGQYLLVYSGNNWNSANYAIGLATCTGPLGPCTEPFSQPILATGPDFSGPGGASVFTDTSGNLWLAFHAWAPNAVGYPNSRGLYIRALNLSGSLPILGPSP